MSQSQDDIVNAQNFVWSYLIKWTQIAKSIESEPIDLDNHVSRLFSIA